MYVVLKFKRALSGLPAHFKAKFAASGDFQERGEAFDFLSSPFLD